MEWGIPGSIQKLRARLVRKGPLQIQIVAFCTVLRSIVGAREQVHRSVAHCNPTRIELMTDKAGGEPIFRSPCLDGIGISKTFSMLEGF